MALLEARTGYIALGVAMALGAKWLAPFFVPALGATVKPLTKAALKASWIGVERGRELLAHVSEAIEDAVAEARAELEAESRAALEKQGSS